MKKQPAPTSKKGPAAKPKSSKTAAKTPLWGQPVFHIVVITVITFILYIPSLSNDWTNWDDNGYVIDNTYVQHFNFSDIPAAFKEKQVMGNYHPLSMISLGIDHYLYGNEARGYHITNLLIHLLSTILLFWFVLLLLSKSFPPAENVKGPRYGAGAVWAASISALLFAIHPMHVESVAWISERKDVLYVCFFFAAAVAWMKYLKASASSSKYLWYSVTLILFLLSLLSKGQAVTFSVLLVVIDLVLERKFTLKVILEKIPFFLLSVGFGVLAIKAQQASSAINFIPFYSWTDKLLFASYALFSYIYKFIVPVTLSAFHPYPLKNGQPYSMLIYASPVLLAIIIAATVIFFRKSRIVWFGVVFFMANIILVLQLLPVGNAIYAERYTYLAYTGLLVMVAYAVSKIFSGEKKLSSYKIPVGVALAVLCIFFFFQSSARIKVWKNSEVLWLDVMSKYDYAPNAYNNLGSYYQKHDDLTKAMYYFTGALRLQSDFPEALINRSDVFRVEGKLDSAIADASHAIKIKPDFDGGYVNRGIAESMMGKYDDALRDFNKAIQLNPDNVKPYSNRANLLALRGEYENSLKDYAVVLKFNPRDYDAYSNRARTYYSMKKYPEALQDITTAIGLKSDDPGYFTLKCDIENAMGDTKAALDDVTHAIQMGAKVNEEFVQSLQQKLNK